jgi:hypothetical protein
VQIKRFGPEKNLASLTLADGSSGASARLAGSSDSRLPYFPMRPEGVVMGRDCHESARMIACCRRNEWAYYRSLRTAFDGSIGLPQALIGHSSCQANVLLDASSNCFPRPGHVEKDLAIW